MMKKILFFIVLIFSAASVRGQFPVNSTLGNKNTTVLTRGIHAADSAFRWVTNYPDTATANFGGLKYIPGSAILVDNKILIRNQTATGWISQGGGSYTFTNGITESGGTVKSGGIISEDTKFYIDNGYNINFDLDPGAESFSITNDGSDTAFIIRDHLNIFFPNIPTSSSITGRKVLVHDTATGRVERVDPSVLGGGTDTTSLSNRINQKWDINGNTGLTKNNFIGHTDSVPLIMKTNGHRMFYISDTWDSTWSSGRGSMQDILIGSNAGGLQTDTIRGLVAIGDSALASFNTHSKWAWGGQMALGHYAGQYNTTGVIQATGWQSLRFNTTGFRNVGCGPSTGRNNISGGYNWYGGQFAGEWATSKSGQTFTGALSGRGGGGENDSYYGGESGLMSSGSITGVTITNSGSGYTTATVTFSSPLNPPVGYNLSVTATGTATISGGAITGITMTNIGLGYNAAHTHTVTITGDGTGATATPILDYSGYNSGFGAFSLHQNKIGKYRTAIGWGAGRYGTQDTGTTDIGANAGKLSTVTANLTNATAIGYNAKTSQNNTIILGDTSIRTSVGIGTTQPAALLDIKSSIGYGFKLSDGREGNYKVLNSDANGNAFWANSPFTTNDAGKIRLPNGAKKNSDSSLIYISVPDADFTSASSYARTPKYTALRFATKDTGAVSVNHPYISFGRHLGQGIMLYDQISDSVACMGIGVASYSLQSYIGNIGGHSFTWNWGGYRGDLSNELMRLTNTGRLGIGTNTPTKVLDINSNSIRLRTAKTPSSATDIGEAGEIAWDENYIYVCVATNTWKRTALSTW